MELLFGFLSGMFLTNSLPHLISGIDGNPHMTPFAKNSSAIVNVIWAFINIAGGIWLLSISGKTIVDTFSLSTFGLSFWVGSLFMALSCAWLFGNKNVRFPWFREQPQTVVEPPKTSGV